MAVLKNRTQGNYTLVSQIIMHDKNLSMAERGLLTTLLSLPDNWQLTIRGLSQILPDGKEKISNNLNKLIEKGYVTREQGRGTKGKFDSTILEVHETPVTPSEHGGDDNKGDKRQINTDFSPCPENRDTANRDTGNPAPGNQPQYINNNISKINTNIFKSINQTDTESADAMTDEMIDVMEKKIEIRSVLDEKLCYDRLVKEHPKQSKLVELIFAVITNTLVHSEKKEINISGFTYSYAEIKDALESLEYDHIVYVISCISSRGKAMTNPTNYILQCLIQAKTKDIYELSQQMKPRINTFNNFQQNAYDFEELEMRLLDN